LINTPVGGALSVVASARCVISEVMGVRLAWTVPVLPVTADKVPVLPSISVKLAVKTKGALRPAELML
jgi:hypothetical protein